MVEQVDSDGAVDACPVVTLACAGLLVRDRSLAANVVRHFRILIDRGLLMPLPTS